MNSGTTHLCLHLLPPARPGLGASQLAGLQYFCGVWSVVYSRGTIVAAYEFVYAPVPNIIAITSSGRTMVVIINNINKYIMTIWWLHFEIIIDD